MSNVKRLKPPFAVEGGFFINYMDAFRILVEHIKVTGIDIMGYRSSVTLNFFCKPSGSYNRETLREFLAAHHPKLLEELTRLYETRAGTTATEKTFAMALDDVLEFVGSAVESNGELEGLKDSYEMVKQQHERLVRAVEPYKRVRGVDGSTVMSTQEAFEIIHDVARLCASKPEKFNPHTNPAAFKRAVREQEALGVVEDFLVNHVWDEPKTPKDVADNDRQADAFRTFVDSVPDEVLNQGSFKPLSTDGHNGQL